MHASVLSGTAAGFLHLIFPRTCAACRCAAVERGVGLCPACSADLALHVDGEYCRWCARDVGRHLLHDGRCTECVQQPRPPLSRFARVGRHRGALRRLVLAFKLERVHDAMLGGLLAAVWRRELGSAGVDAIVPIPSPWLRRWRRGFHPTALLARCVARSAGVPCRRWMAMARPVRPQTGLSAALRERNIRGAFKCMRAAPVQGRTIGLIDDVSTTGATLREAARTLRAAGARDVVAAVVTRAVLAETPDA